MTSVPDGMAARTRQRWLMITFASLIGIKAISSTYSLFISGASVRLLSAADAYVLLATPNYLAVLGLLQLGLGAFVARRASQQAARGAPLSDMADVRGAFHLMLMMSVVGMVFVLGSGAFPKAVWPTGLLLLLGLWASMAEAIRLANKRTPVNNLILAGAYLTFAAVAIFNIATKGHALWLFILCTYGPPFAASAVSFAISCSSPAFRSLIAIGPRSDIRGAVISAAPLFAYSAAATALQNVPMLGQAWSGFPKLSLESLAALRLFVSILTLYYFLLMPLLPYIVELHVDPSDAGNLRRSRTMIAGFAVAALMIGVGLWLFEPVFIKLWLGKIQISHVTSAKWGLISALWITVTSNGFVLQAANRAAQATLIFGASAAITAASPIVFGVGTGEVAMICGLALGATLSYLLLKPLMFPAQFPTAGGL